MEQKAGFNEPRGNGFCFPISRQNVVRFPAKISPDFGPKFCPIIPAEKIARFFHVKNFAQFFPAKILPNYSRQKNRPIFSHQNFARFFPPKFRPIFSRQNFAGAEWRRHSSCLYLSK
jgi:hypothetical protein